MTFIEIEVLAHRFLYYVLAMPVLSDYEYDALEAKARKELPATSRVHGVGSDLIEDYPPEVAAFAMDLLRR